MQDFRRRWAIVVIKQGFFDLLKYFQKSCTFFFHTIQIGNFSYQKDYKILEIKYKKKKTIRELVIHWSWTWVWRTTLSIFLRSFKYFILLPGSTLKIQFTQKLLRKTWHIPRNTLFQARICAESLSFSTKNLFKLFKLFTWCLDCLAIWINSSKHKGSFSNNFCR